MKNTERTGRISNKERKIMCSYNLSTREKRPYVDKGRKESKRVRSLKYYEFED